MPTTQSLRLGTRGSKLALWQAQWVAARLRECGYSVELVEIATQGDLQQAGPLSALGGEGVFTKALQRVLLAREIDVAVHSLKDLPTEPVEGLTIGAVPARADAADVLVTRHFRSIQALPHAARVGTGSLRRKAQLLHLRPDLTVAGVRGNVDTRLAKLDQEQFDALVLAAAGLQRLGLEQRISYSFPPSEMLPAVGQGALGIECRADDTDTRTAVTQIHHSQTHSAITAERALLSRLRAGCSAPVGALARTDGLDQLRLAAAVLSADGRKRIFHEEAASREDAEQLGTRVADALLSQGADELIRAAHGGD